LNHEKLQRFPLKRSDKFPIKIYNNSRLSIHEFKQNRNSFYRAIATPTEQSSSVIRIPQFLGGKHHPKLTDPTNFALSAQQNNVALSIYSNFALIFRFQIINFAISILLQNFLEFFQTIFIQNDDVTLHCHITQLKGSETFSCIQRGNNLNFSVKFLNYSN
jgi:hypothetical protein